jgi:hypothetical protein
MLTFRRLLLAFYFLLVLSILVELLEIHTFWIGGVLGVMSWVSAVTIIEE